MNLFNRLMALTGFAALTAGFIGMLLAGEVGGAALGWVLDLSSTLAPHPPLAF